MTRSVASTCVKSVDISYTYGVAMKYLEFQLRKPRRAVEPSSMGARYSGAGVKYEPRSGNRESIFRVYVETLPGYSPLKVITCTSFNTNKLGQKNAPISLGMLRAIPFVGWLGTCLTFCGILIHSPLRCMQV